MIEVTDIAIAKLIEKKVDSVRLGVTGGGCSGYEYVFVEDHIREGDHVEDYGNFSFLIDLSFVNGMFAIDLIKKDLITLGIYFFTLSIILFCDLIKLFILIFKI